jgi:hypothetical protein
LNGFYTLRGAGNAFAARFTPTKSMDFKPHLLGNRCFATSRKRAAICAKQHFRDASDNAQKDHHDKEKTANKQDDQTSYTQRRRKQESCARRRPSG